MPTLCYMPPTCGVGIHVILEEIDKPYTLRKIDFREHEHNSPEYLALNPKGKVPILIRDDGSVLTELPAIAVWLALTHSEKKLLSTDPELMARTLEVMDYIVATLHMQAWSRFFRPQNYSSVPEEQTKIRTQGREMLDAGFLLLEELIGERAWLIGEFSIADCTLYFLELWCDRAALTFPPKIKAHYERMNARPSVQKVLELEGMTE